MSLTVSAWAKGRDRRTGTDIAVRIQIIREDYDVNEEYGLRSEASGLYRKTYGEWADELGSSTVDAGGHRQRYIPPGTLKEDGDYTVPGELFEDDEDPALEPG